MFERIPNIGIHLSVLMIAAISGAVSAEPSVGPGMIVDSAEYEMYMREFIAPGNIPEAHAIAFNWKDLDMVTPVKNQGSCTSAWAFVSTALLESRVLMLGYDAYDFSEQQLVSCVVGNCLESATLHEALSVWDTEGPMIESCTGYPSYYSVVPPCTDYDTCEQLEIRGHGYYTVNMSSSENIKTSVYYDGPGFFAHTLYEDFFTFWSEASPGDVYVNTGGSTISGLHPVLIIGWDDYKGAWLIKNSWGETGPEGDGTYWLAYSGHVNDLHFLMANLAEVTVEEGTEDCTCDEGCKSLRTSPGALNTTDAVCYEIEDDIYGWTAWNIQGRTIEVNDVVVSQGGSLPPKINGKYYLGFSAGTYPWAGWTYWNW